MGTRLDEPTSAFEDDPGAFLAVVVIVIVAGLLISWALTSWFGVPQCAYRGDCDGWIPGAM